MLSLPEAADLLGVHRATVNEMVLTGRLPAERVGPHWVIDENEFNRFRSTYERPKHYTRPKGASQASDHWVAHLLQLLAEWDSATVAELSEVVDLVPGNIRKYLCIAEARGLAVRNEYGDWMLTSGGRGQVGSPPATRPERESPSRVKAG